MLKICPFKLRFFAFIFSFAVLAGCDVEDHFMDDCYKPYLLRVMVSDDANDGFHPENFAPNDISLMLEPREVLVYVFCKEMRFLGVHRTKVGELVELPYKGYEQIYVAAVATAQGVPIETLFTQFEIGKQYSKTDLLFALTPIAAQQGFAQSPTDFMYASDNFSMNPYNDKNIIYYLFLEPRIGAVKIKTVGLQAWADSTYGKTGLLQDQFTFVVGTTFDKYNLGGELYGDTAKYTPITLYATTDNIGTPMFNLMPNEDKGVKIFIYRNGTFIYPETDYQKSLAYKIYPRAPYIININFKNPLDGGISITPSEFDDVIIHVEF